MVAELSVHAAEELGRKWFGVDISNFSNGLIRNRLRHEFPSIDIEIRGNPISVADAISLAKRDRFEFEKWVCGEIGAQGMYHDSGARGSDGGVDGIIPFYHTSRENQHKSEQAYAIVQVKSRKVTPDNVKALSATVKQHKDNGFNSICGIFVCFEKYMRTVENNRDKSRVTNYFLDKSFDFIQPFSVESLLAGRLPYFPGGIVTRLRRKYEKRICVTNKVSRCSKAPPPKASAFYNTNSFFAAVRSKSECTN